MVSAGRSAPTGLGCATSRDEGIADPLASVSELHAEDPMRSLALRFGKNVSWLFAGEVLRKGLLLVVFVLLGRGSGAAALGAFTVAMSAVLVALPALLAGQVEMLIRETARRPGEARALLAGARRNQRWTLGVGLLVAALWLVFVRDPAIRAVFLALLPYAWLRVETFTRTAVFRGLDRMDVEVQAHGIEVAGSLTMVTLAVLGGAPPWVAGLGLSAGSALAVAWLVTRTRLLPPSTGVGVSRLPLRESLPFLGLGVFLQLLLRIDVFLLAVLAVAASAIGVYGAAAALVWGALAFPQLVAIAVFPSVSRVAARGGAPARAGLAAAGAGLALGAAVAGAVWPLRHVIITVLFGTGFVSGAEVLGVLVWAFPGASLSMVLGVVVAAWGRQRWSLAVLAVSCLLMTLLGLLWIPRFGMSGAAAAAVAAHTFAGLGSFAVAVWPGRVRFSRPTETVSGQAVG
jgi:O-antigen/teichoic acid export membrane protein